MQLSCSGNFDAIKILNPSEQFDLNFNPYAKEANINL
jgi:hypothetical protein